MSNEWTKGTELPEPGWYWIVIFDEFSKKECVIPNPFSYGLSGFEWTDWHEQTLNRMIAYKKITAPEWDRNNRK